ncbi:hypothetical protein [Petrocella sp. FN5]|uniref:hypothetical protein n=1 Tax=Petrocella sp. FN5 TaxID=3032002 RepID=UPI0023D9C8EB|nr:hypothetical protein [Petrocella sp. FN5]MDF1617271.1 hypothetical protein [Petrocella sp. FN5]
MESKKYKLINALIIKEFESATRDKKYIIVHKKKHWIIAEELYLILSFLDGENTLSDICCKLQSLGISSTAEDLEKIIKTHIVSKGIVEGYEGEAENEKKSKYFWFQVNILKESLIKKLSFTKYPYNKVFSLLVLILSIPGFFIILRSIALPDFYLMIPTVSYKDWMIITLLIISSGYIHELGHAGASMHYGIVPYSIGFAFYMTMPVLFADVSGIWVLKRKQRAVVDLGGIYFEHLYLCTLAIITIITKSNIILIATVIRYIGLIYNFNPFLKMDGYWLFTDLSGISNLHDTTVRYIKAKLLRPFSISIYEPHNELTSKSKIVFYLYVMISLVFFIFFATLLKNITLTAFELLPFAKEDLLNFFELGSIMEILKSIAIYFKNYFMVFISAFLVIRIIYTTFRNITLLILEVRNKKSQNTQISTKLPVSRE